MVVYFDPAKGIVDDQASVLEQSMPAGLDPIGKKNWMLQQQADAANTMFEQGAAQGGNKPLLAQDPGQFFDELGNILGNAGTGLVTDYLDLGAGLADVAVQTASLASGGGWDWNQVFNDSDNPWTQWRQSNFEAQTSAGQLTSNIVRVGTLLLTLPKTGIKGLALLPRLAQRVPVVGGAAGKVTRGLDALDDTLKASRNIRQTTQLTEAAAEFKKGTAAAAAAKIGMADDWLGMTFQQISKANQADEVTTWWKSVRDSTKALTQLTREKGRVRTVAEALGWDAFAAFLVYGEGDSSFDETLNDMLAEAGLPNIPFLQTRVEDTGLIRKFKQMAEGVPTGLLINGLLDMTRVYRYSQAFGKATAEEKEQLIKAFNTEADEIGRGLARLALPAQIGAHPDIAARSAKETRLNGLRAMVDSEKIAQNYQRDLDVAQLLSNQRMAAEAAGVQPPDRLPTGPWDPTRGPAGLLPEGRVPADFNSPVQNRLAQMEGLASQLNEDPLYQEWLASRAPDELFMPPQAGGNPALEQFQGQGAMPAPSAQGGPDDLQAYKQWLESRARMPGAELDPRVQQSLRRLEGIGELALRQPEGLAMPAGQLGQPAQMGNLPQLPGGPEAKPPGAPPAGLLGAGGEMVPVTPGIQPVNVVDLGPRPPAPTVTPQTIRNAFEADIYDAFMRSQELTFEEGPDGVMRSMAELRSSIKQLVPSTRVDAIEYMDSFTPMANELGVVNASDSVWMNFITNRGLSEGWASIDPDTMKVRFNRRAAVELDRGESAIKQAESLDQLNELNRYQEWLWNKELVNGNPQMRPEVQDNLAAKEARDAYDQWEAGQTAQRMAEPDPAKLDAERQAVTAAVEADQLNNAEELRLTAAEQAALSGQLDDATVVREYLGTTLDSVQRPEVAKAEVGRGWEVLGADGEPLAKTRTKREAERLADAELQRLREAMVNRARQLEADDADQALNMTTGSPIYDSDVVGKVTLTETQVEAVKRYSEAIRRQLDADFIKRTGGQAFFNVNDIKGSKRTFEMTQGEMYDIVDGIKALLGTGEITGAKARVLRNIADKLDTSMRLLEPEARAQRFANNITAGTKRFLDHGDFC